MSGTYSKTIFDIQTLSERFFEKCEKKWFLALKNAHILQDKVEISTWTGFLIQIILEICLEMFCFLSSSIPCNKRPSFETYDIFCNELAKLLFFAKHHYDLNGFRFHFSLRDSTLSCCWSERWESQLSVNIWFVGSILTSWKPNCVES